LLVLPAAEELTEETACFVAAAAAANGTRAVRGPTIWTGRQLLWEGGGGVSRIRWVGRVRSARAGVFFGLELAR
jgi:hypothetical protein